MNQPQCKTFSDLHRAWANVLDMCAGTKVSPVDCWNHPGKTERTSPTLGAFPEHYDFAIGIVEDKPVFIGDKLWNIPNNFKFTVTGADLWGENPRIIGGDRCGRVEDCSWSPPKPKTIMVELLVEDVKYYADEYPMLLVEIEKIQERRREACRKALDELGKSK